MVIIRVFNALSVCVCVCVCGGGGGGGDEEYSIIFIYYV